MKFRDILAFSGWDWNLQSPPISQGRNWILRVVCIGIHILYTHIWGFPKMVVPQNGWFIRANPIKMDDLGVPLFLETPIYTSKKL